jgi:hypothetical protein
MRPLVAHCQLGLGRLYGRTGSRERAHQHLASAVTMYREMDMRFWLRQAETEIGLPA